MSQTTSAENDITFGYDDPRPARWQAATDAYAVGYWRHGWANRIERIARIDTASKKITLEKAPGYGIQPKKPYYVVNLLEEIDRPGEWYLDRQAGILYLWPPKDIAGADILISTLAEPLVTMKDVAHVRLDGFVIEMGTDNGIDVRDGRDVRITDCIVRNLRKNAINLNGQRNIVDRCQIYGIGQTGVAVSGGDRHQLTPGENAVRNCTIHDFGRWQRTYAPAVSLRDVGNITEHNRLLRRAAFGDPVQRQ